MTIPQPGIFALGTAVHMHLELDRIAGVENEELRGALGDAWRVVAGAGLTNLVVGLGAAIAASVVPGVPGELRPFEPLIGAGGPGAPATQHDLWIWIHGSSHDAVFDAGRASVRHLAGVATLRHEQACQVYRSHRDLTGFIDGTENPPIHEAMEAALVPQGKTGAGGSFAMTQRWVHDLERFEALSIEEQQRVIGRTKPDSLELDGSIRPETAHISRVVIEEEGHELEIFRRSVPFGTISEHGLFFVAFSHEPRRFTRMLGRMFGTEDGIRDRLTEFSRPVTGSFYFCPSLTDLIGGVLEPS